MSHKFKVGDKAVRVEASCWPDEFGHVGHIYTVLSVNQAGHIQVIPNCGCAEWFAFEFAHNTKNDPVEEYL